MHLSFYIVFISIILSCCDVVARRWGGPIYKPLNQRIAEKKKLDEFNKLWAEAKEGFINENRYNTCVYY